jgi:hypothetical protein
MPSRFPFPALACRTVPGPVVSGNGAVGLRPASPTPPASTGRLAGTGNAATLFALFELFGHGYRFPLGERNHFRARELGKAGTLFALFALFAQGPWEAHKYGLF